MIRVEVEDSRGNRAVVATSEKYNPDAADDLISRLKVAYDDMLDVQYRYEWWGDDDPAEDDEAVYTEDDGGDA